MAVRKNKFSKFAQLIQRGLRLSFQNLVAETAKQDGELVLCVNGEIKHVKAKSLLKKKKSR